MTFSVPSVPSVVLRFNFSVLSEEIATRTKGKKSGKGLNHRGHRGHKERHSDFPLCPLCPLWLDFSDLCLRLGSGYAGLGLALLLVHSLL